MNTKATLRLATKMTKDESNCGNTKPNTKEAIIDVIGSPMRNTLMWQSLSPGLRAEALKRAQLVQLLKQVNPELQLCRKSTNDASVQAKTTLEKGIQVPDIRFELAANWKVKPRKPIVCGGFVGPGVRIKPRQSTPSCDARQNFPGYPPMINLRRPPPFTVSRSILRPEAPPHTPRGIAAHTNQPVRRQQKDENRKANSPCKPAEQMTISTADYGSYIAAKRKKAAELEGKTVETKLTIEDCEEKVDLENKVANNQKTASSGDDDSVVVVLDEPKKERDLERKYGQFFCRRCLRGWSSRNVWCVRNSCKVYIKQTCNMCHRIVNPYLVCHLPGPFV
uniref:Zygote arrest protein 1-like n=1 Tax=Ciona intestinalis TaxID=7719 RepID=F6TV42_CIOIN|nr:zygote arrest protein 1-like isoform X1 [Ciona intestinalis]|eukprot:XP_026690417.1 zygote arrest protein 1-like isoform X1 [Ciona intestinalis]